jgi:single-stranded DNA-binding protein
MFIVTEILGKVTNIADGTSKNGKPWCRANVQCRVYTGNRDNPYETRFINAVCFDQKAEKLKAQVSVGTMLFARGEAKPGKPWKTNKGEEVQTTDLVIRDFYAAGQFVDTREAAATTTEEPEDDNPFA